MKCTGKGHSFVPVAVIRCIAGRLVEMNCRSSVWVVIVDGRTCRRSQNLV